MQRNFLQYGPKFSSNVSVEQRLSKDRFLTTLRAKLMVSETSVHCGLVPKALTRVFLRTKTPRSLVSAWNSTVSSSFIVNDFKMKQGAPGPPNRMSAPRLTLCGRTTPVGDGEGIRFPFTNVPCALPQSTT
jgi:hypothetical protein